MRYSWQSGHNPFSLQASYCHSSFSTGELESKQSAILCHWRPHLPLIDEAVLPLQALQIHWDKMQAGPQLTRGALLVLG